MPTDEETSTESLMNSVVQSLFGVFGAPDDLAAAQQADALLEALHQRLVAANG